MNRVDPRLYGIIGPEQALGTSLGTIARAAVAGGCTLLQYRDKTSETRVLVDNARALKAALDGSGVPLLVNDRIDVALAAGADGVHVGQDDMHPDDARRLLGPRAIIGITINNPGEASELAQLPVDYACIGGVFATTSKTNPHPPIGLDGLARLAALAREAAPSLPLPAIAGIDAANAASVIGAGADGVAVISALFGKSDVREAARSLRAIVDGAFAARGAWSR